MSDTAPAPQPRSDAPDLRVRRRRRPPRHAAAGRSARHRLAASPAQQAGYFVDTRDASGRTLARVAAPGAFPDSVEVFPERHGEPITRMPVDRPRGAFTIIVPVPQDADHVRVVQVTPPQGDATQPTDPLGSPARPARRKSGKSPGSRFRSAVEGEQPCPPQTARSSDRRRSSAAHPATARSIVVLLAEGFTAAQQADFNAACGEFVTAFRATPPFDELSPAHQHLPGECQLDRFRCR